MYQTTHARLQRAVLILSAIAAVLVIAACGSSSSSSGTKSASGPQPAASTSGSISSRRAALQACLQKHGVTLPARPSGGRGFFGGAPQGGSGTGTAGQQNGGGFFRNPKVRSALRACGANFRGFRGRRLSHQAINNFVTCVRQHGYSMPNPNFSGNGPVFPATIRSDPKFQAASRQCQNLLVPQRGGSAAPSA